MPSFHGVIPKSTDHALVIHGSTARRVPHDALLGTRTTIAVPRAPVDLVVYFTTECVGPAMSTGTLWTRVCLALAGRSFAGPAFGTFTEVASEALTDMWPISLPSARFSVVLDQRILFNCLAIRLLRLKVQFVTLSLSLCRTIHR